MNIRAYDGKKVAIIDWDGQQLAGTVIDYVYPEDNEPEGESIIIRSVDGGLIEFRPAEIKVITEIQ